MGLSEENLIKSLPAIIVDPTNRAKVEALLAGNKKEILGGESTK